jgi:hypothetical protein
MGPKFLMARTAGHPRPDGRHEAPRTRRQHGEEVNVVGTAAAPFLVSWDVPVRPVGTGPFPCLSWPILNPRVTHFVQIGTVLICRNDSLPLTFCHGAYKRGDGVGDTHQGRRVSTPRARVLGNGAHRLDRRGASRFDDDGASLAPFSK